MHRHRWSALRDATVAAEVLRPGATEPALRQALARGEAPPELVGLVEKVRLHAYRVTDEDIAQLKNRYTEDQIFEMVVAATVGVAGEKLDAALAALDAAVEP